MMLKASRMRDGGDSLNLQTHPMQENKEVALVARDIETIWSWQEMCEARGDAAYCAIMIGARGRIRVMGSMRLGF